jgi:hypothetical protein
MRRLAKESPRFIGLAPSDGDVDEAAQNLISQRSRRPTGIVASIEVGVALEQRCNELQQLWMRRFGLRIKRLDVVAEGLRRRVERQRRKPGIEVRSRPSEFCDPLSFGPAPGLDLGVIA